MSGFRRRIMLSAGALVTCLSCVTGVEPTRDNPIPVLQRIEPALITAGSASPSILLVGADFVEGVSVTWNGQPRATAFESENRLRASVEADDIAVQGSAAIVVHNPTPGGGASSPLVLQVGNPEPHIDSISPDVAEAVVTASLSVRVFGRGFSSFGGGSKVVFQGAVVPTQLVSATELHAELADYLLQRGQTASVVVVNPPPGGGASNPVPFGVANPVPVVTGIRPDSIPLKSSATVEVDGVGFVTGMAVWMDGVRYEPLAVSPYSIVFTVPASALTRQSGHVQVESPAPGGGLSNEVQLGIQEVRPAIVQTMPEGFEIGSGAHTLRVYGSDFAPDAVVTWNGTARATLSVHRDTLEIAIAASDVATFGMGMVSVENPRGGGAAAPRAVVIVPPGRIAYTLRGHGLRSSTLTGADVRPITAASAEGLAAWPVGEAVVYTKSIDPGLFLVAPGVPQTMVLSEYVNWPRVPLSGDWIYIGSDHCCPRVLGIGRVRPDGTGLEEILPVPPSGVLHRWPDPSPSGDRLLYARYDNTLPLGSRDDLLILDLGTGMTTSVGVAAYETRWSPDESWLAYRHVHGTLRLIRPDGTGDRAIVAGAAGFDWSPDGSHLLVIVDGYLLLIDIATGLAVSLPIGERTPPIEYLGGVIRNVAWYPNPGGVP